MKKDFTTENEIADKGNTASRGNTANRADTTGNSAANKNNTANRADTTGSNSTEPRTMENAAPDSHIQVYEKDYAEEFLLRARTSSGRDFLDTLQEIGFFKTYKEEMDKIPKRIVPKSKADYEYLLGECDAYVRQFGGRIRGVVDYENWQAVIEMYMEHFEFCDREALGLLKEMAERADNVTFSVVERGMRVSVCIRYFDEVY